MAYCLAIDIGASSGRHLLGELRDGKLITEEVYRFENGYTATLVSGCYSKGVRPRCGLYITLSDIVFDYRLRNNLIISTPEGTTDTPRGVDQTYLLDEAFVNAVLTGDSSGIRSDYADALKSHKMVFAANESMESGQVIYFK